jgi:predicted deacylase
MNSPFPNISPGRHRLDFFVETDCGAVRRMALPHLVLAGGQSGPQIAVTAGQHGREVAGILATASVFNALDPSLVCGTIHFFPTLNPLALAIGRQDFPAEESRYRKLTIDVESNLDRLWGGGRQATDPILSATTRAVWDGCLEGCDAILDLHAWSRFFCPMAWAHERDAALIEATGFPWIRLRTDRPEGSLHTLRERAWASRKPVVVVELPGQNSASREAMELGCRTIRNFLAATGSLRESPVLPAGRILLRGGESDTRIFSDAMGLWSPAVRAGCILSAGDVLGEVLGCSTFEAVRKVVAPHAGLLGFNGPFLSGEDAQERQLVYPGEKLAVLHRIDSVQGEPPVPFF